MPIKRNASTEDVRKKMIAKFWVMARTIGEDYAYECAASLYPRKVTTYPHRGLSSCSIEELGDIITELIQKTTGGDEAPKTRKTHEIKPQRAQRTQRKQRVEPTGQPVVIPEYGNPATGRQIEQMHRLAGELNIDDAYLIGIYQKVTGGKVGPMTVGIAQSVIEALKQIQYRK